MAEHSPQPTEPEGSSPTPPGDPGGSSLDRSGNVLVRLRSFYETHPFLGNFWLLAPAMVVILLVSIQSTPMEPSQRFAIVVATIALAAACAWIIGQSADGDDPSP